MWDGKVKRAVTVWHRRSGKDTTWLNLTVGKMMQRVGTYLHLYPELKRGRKSMWDAINRNGMKFLDHFPPSFVKKRNESEMQIECVNGSIWKIEGVENLDSVVGSNPVGVVFSEFSQMKPAAGDLIRPILAENDGWAGFNFTPRGKNHAYELYNMALHNPDWFASLLTTNDTRRDGPEEDGSPVVPPAYRGRRREGMRSRS